MSCGWERHGESRQSIPPEYCDVWIARTGQRRACTRSCSPAWRDLTMGTRARAEAAAVSRGSRSRWARARAKPPQDFTK